MYRSKYIEQQIEKIYTSVFNKIFKGSRLKSAMKGSTSDIAKAVDKLSSSKQYEKFATEFSKKLAKKGISHQKGLWKKYYEAAKAAKYIVLPATYKKFELDILNKAIKHNFRMIKTIPERMLELYKHKYVDMLIAQVAKGTIGRNSFLKQLKEHGHKNAGVIARTETAKLQTAIDEMRATSLGSVAYEWLSSHDIRTRPSHKAMNGVIVFWRKDDEKPLLDNMRGNAGEFPNCRCATLPILHESDLDKSNYNVYDYQQDKIVKMSKQKLVECLKKGHL